MTSLNLNAEQMVNIETYRSTVNKLVRTALSSTSDNKMISLNMTNDHDFLSNLAVQMLETVEQNHEQSDQTITTDTREYTERRAIEKDKE